MEEDPDERVYTVWGTDELGDSHMFSTTSEERVLTAFSDMVTRYEEVRYNYGTALALRKAQRDAALASLLSLISSTG